ncbi:hypothetical protein U1Q18_036684 [Sarracenia purpurea var. burkii]
MGHNFEQLRTSFRGFGAHRRRVVDQWYCDPKEAQKVSMIEGCSLAAERDDKRRKSQRLISATVFAQWDWALGIN